MNSRILQFIKVMNKLLFILFCLPIIVSGQCVPKDGCKNGHGTYTWEDGSIYVGEWKDSQLNGQGTYTGKDGSVKIGVWKDGRLIDSRQLEYHIKKSVEHKINAWQQKGEFEKTTDYLIRVNDKNRTIKIKEFQQKSLNDLKRGFISSINFSDIELGDYDADNETFLLSESKLGNIVISVPIISAKLFKENFSSFEFLNPECIIIDNEFILSYVELTFEHREYIYSVSNVKDYTITDVDYEFASFEIDNITSAKKSYQSNITTNKITVGTSSVNINIPTNEKVKYRYALVIGNEDYTSFQRTLSAEQNVDYAVSDATVFKDYCLSTLGVKEENMEFITDAGAVDMNKKIKKVSKIIKALGRKAELIVYYAGHGIPHEITKTPYLIPVDVSASELSYAIKLDDLYKDLGSTGAKSITIFLDACFTGGGRSSGLLASNRGPKVKPKEGSLTGNLIVFSASSGNQAALANDNEGHGMFTFYLLKKFQESNGKVSMGDLADYLYQKVSIQSLKINEKEQNPSINASKAFNDWKSWKF